MKRLKLLRDFDSLYELMEHFTTEEKCVNHLAHIRWQGKPTCPYCDHDHAYEMNVTGRGKRWKCAECRKQFSVRVGTVFEESKIPLKKWFVAIYLITSHKKGISSHQLARDLKVTQKTAWFLLHRVRHCYAPDLEIFTGPVELDETWVGGKEKNKHADKKVKGSHGRPALSKTPVFGIFQRGGKVFALPVKDTTASDLFPVLRERVETGVHVYTDDWRSYRGLKHEYQHHIINHRASEYVRGDVHTQNIESFWALLKRGILGIYHQVSPKHLDKYVNEFTFRFNNRDMTEGSRFDILLANTNGRLDYKTLIQSDHSALN